jgi:tail tube protein
MPNRHGRETQLLLQRQVASRTAPAAAAFKMKYNNGIVLGREPERQPDNTINNNALEEKMDEGDAIISHSIPAILCLNDIGQWLSLLLGAPVTSGVGPYTHTFTLDLADPLIALMEMGYMNTGNEEYIRWYDNVVSSMSWNVLEGEQNMQVNMLGGVQVSPNPGAVFDAAPTSYAKNRGCAKQGEIYDVDGASTLGKVVGGTVNIDRDLEGQRLADGLEGFAEFLVAQPKLNGSLQALRTTTTNMFDHAFAHTSKALSLVSKNVAGDATLTVNIPQIEIEEKKHEIPTSKGIIDDFTWKAHADATDTTVVLVNGIASY